MIWNRFPGKMGVFFTGNYRDDARYTFGNTDICF